MLRAWRRVTVVALTVGVAIGTQLALLAPAQAVTPTITIAATSQLQPVTGFVLVAFHGGSSASARIHGSITGAAKGEVATLYAQRFPYTKAFKRVSSVTLSPTGTATPYSFRVTPTLATRYKVKLFAKSTRLATSPTQNVYVTVSGGVTGVKPCGRPVCHETLRLVEILPPSALGVEMSKHTYPYFGLRLGTVGRPPLPKWLYLNAGHASVAAPRQISAGEFETTLRFSFTIGNHPYRWSWIACVKDTVSRDGLGLPGHHGCGSSPVRRTVSYLG